MGARVSEGTKAFLALAAVIAVVGAVPLLLDRDSFPLSTYPMFSHRRSTTEDVDTAVAIDQRTGQARRLDPEAIAGIDEEVIATVIVGKAIRNGTADALCAEIAERVSHGADGGSDAATVEVVTERFDAVNWYRGDRTPIERHVHASCPVPASGEASP